MLREPISLSGVQTDNANLSAVRFGLLAGPRRFSCRQQPSLGTNGGTPDYFSLRDSEAAEEKGVFEGQVAEVVVTARRTAVSFAQLCP